MPTNAGFIPGDKMYRLVETLPSGVEFYHGPYKESTAKGQLTTSRKSWPGRTYRLQVTETNWKDV